MTTERSTFRAMARAALSDDARMGAFAQLSAWASGLKADQLPVLAVVTPQERITPEAMDHFSCAPLMQVVAKRLGGDTIEDDLDEDAAAIEACIVRAFLAAGVHCLPEEATTVVNFDGEQRIGVVTVNFRLRYLRVVPFSAS